MTYRLQFLSQHSKEWTDVGKEFESDDYDELLAIGQARGASRVFEYRIVSTTGVEVIKRDLPL